MHEKTTKKIISPLYDFAFAQIFGSQRNIDNTRGFLKKLLDIPEADYSRLTVKNPILKRFFRQDKMGIVDLKLSTKSGRIIHIELQVSPQAYLKNRILYYAARLIGDQLKWGEHYKKLHQVISIVICDHVLLDEEPSYMNWYQLRNEKNHSFTEMVKLVILELPKLPEMRFDTVQAKDAGILPWLWFLKSETKEELDMLAKNYPELEKPVFCAQKMSLLEKWRDIHFHKNLWKEDERMRKLYVREQALAEGHAEGLAKGEAKKSLEIARKMKGRGRPLAEIAEDTGLSIEAIEKL